MAIKEVVSASLGSSQRDHRVEVDFRGERYAVSRRGCDGDTDRYAQLLVELDEDPNVAAIGMGGVSMYLDAAGRRFYFRDIKRFARLVKNKALVDGTAMKGVVEADAVRFMQEDLGLDLSDKRVIATASVDRWGLGEAFEAAAKETRYGDLYWGLGVPIMIDSPQVLATLIRLVAPLAFQMPYQWLYPIETDHTWQPKRSEFSDKLYRDADIIAGDYKFVVKHMPDDMTGKWIVTNTTTAKDAEYLKARGVELLVTTTPILEGRSFGTNVIEALLVASEGAAGPLTGERYLELLRGEGFLPGALWLQRG